METEKLTQLKEEINKIQTVDELREYRNSHMSEKSSEKDYNKKLERLIYYRWITLTKNDTSRYDLNGDSNSHLKSLESDERYHSKPKGHDKTCCILLFLIIFFIMGIYGVMSRKGMGQLADEYAKTHYLCFLRFIINQTI